MKFVKLDESRYLNVEGIKELRLVDWDGTPLSNEEDIEDSETVQIAAVYNDGTLHCLEDVRYCQALARLADVVHELEGAERHGL